MTEVTVVYHREPDGSWWADSSDMAGFTAVGESRNEVRQLVREGVVFHFERDDVEIDERFPDAELVAMKISGWVGRPAATASQGGTTKSSRHARPVSV